jgi:predicted DNA-binding protein (UPF0251 family)
MPRPAQPRRIDLPRPVAGFKPIGRPLRATPVLTLALDGLEALRLADLEGLYQEAAAERMGVSRPTFARVLARARAAVAEALVEGKVLVVGEAPVVTGEGEPIPCPLHGGGRRRGRGCRCAAHGHPGPGSEGPAGGHHGAV